jgi:hypothetical protein
MNRANKVFLPKMNKTQISRHTRGSISGRGVGAFLLDGGLGGQSSYQSVDDYISTTNASPVVSTGSIGSGLKGLERIRSKMENMVIKPSIRKPKNIKFSM